MDLDTLTIEEIRKLDQAGLQETEVAIRKQLATIRMDIYSPAAAAVGKVRKLHAGLARLMTVRTEIRRSAPKAAKPVAATKKVAAKVKKVKAAAKTAPKKKKA